MANNNARRSSSTASPRATQPIFRPDWPWSSRTYASNRNLQSPLSSSSTSTPTPQQRWEARSTMLSSTTVSTSSNAGGWRGSTFSKFSPQSALRPEDGQATRQWSLAGFEWLIKDVSKLRDFVEETVVAGAEGEQNQHTADDFDVLNQSPILGDNRFKLEIAPTSPSEGTTTQLSLYITSLLLDFRDAHHGDLETSATMMAAIKCQGEKVGERGSRPEWVWEFWQQDWTFRHESEVWECPLPPISELLENERIHETDSFVLCVQIHSPSGPAIPQQPAVCYVPRDLLDGLEASLDNANTGDVRFVCLERRFVGKEEHSDSSQVLSSAASSTSASSHCAFSTRMTARKRIIYAHSDILVRRSDYFATMLSSSFSENETSVPASGERQMRTIVVEEADFETIYWLLKFCYANWLLFKENEDPREAVDGVGSAWSTKWLALRHDNEWDWKTCSNHVSDDTPVDARSAISGDSNIFSAPVSRSTSRKSDTAESTPSPATVSNRTTSKPNPLGNTRQPPSTAPKQRIGATETSRAPASGAAGSSSRSKANAVSVTSGYPSVRAHPSPHPPRQGTTSMRDPHPHPTPTPPPASALAMYQVAHRYGMTNLVTLALEHIMSTITPASCFPLLLASYTWDELYALVEDYVVDKWDEVYESEEFKRCCNEIAAGEWGAGGGGQTLMSVFKRLRSPSTAA